MEGPIKSLSVCLSVCLSVSLFVCLSVCQSVHLFVCLFASSGIFLSNGALVIPDFLHNSRQLEYLKTDRALFFSREIHFCPNW